MKGSLKMKLNDKFLIHDTGSGEILVPVGEESKSFHGIIKLNETGSVIVHLLEKDDLSIEEIMEYFYSHYECDESIKGDIELFINKLKEVNAIEY